MRRLLEPLAMRPLALLLGLALYAFIAAILVPKLIEDKLYWRLRQKELRSRAT